MAEAEPSTAPEASPAALAALVLVKPLLAVPTDRWTMRALFEGGGTGAGPYRTAGAADPALMDYVDGIIAGDPFDAAGEARIKAQGWTPTD